MKKILLVEDDLDMVSLLKIHLNQLDVTLTHFANGMEALKDLKSSSYDLLILDVMIPGLDGVSLLQRTREMGVTTPVVLLTARSEEIDKVVGLESGADDYITKPFSVREFIARVKGHVASGGYGSQRCGTDARKTDQI